MKKQEDLAAQLIAHALQPRRVSAITSHQSYAMLPTPDRTLLLPSGAEYKYVETASGKVELRRINKPKTKRNRTMGEPYLKTKTER